jgi:hypothetical protein
MVDLIPPQTVLTPTGAANELSARGLEAFGLTVPALSPVWAGSDPAAGDFVEATLRLTLNQPRAPFRGIRSFTTGPAAFSGPGGVPLTGPTLVFALHPEAARRLERLVEARYGAPRQRPVPVAMLVHGATIPATPPAPQWFLASETLDPGPAGNFAVSFHDARGLVVDPIAAAHMLRDLLAWRPGLLSVIGGLGVGSPGGLDAVAALGTGVLVHVIDPHGSVFRPLGAATRLKVTDGADAQLAEVTDSGLVTLAAGQGIGRAAGDDPAPAGDPPLRWGWALGGTLARTRLIPPALPGGVTLDRQFLRVMAVDLPWHLRGNRSNTTQRGIPPHDGPDDAAMLPVVRDPVPGFAFLADPMQVLGAMGAMAAGFPPAGASSFAIAVSPVLDAALTVPPAPDVTGRWPAFPPPDTGADLTATTDPRVGLIARWRAAGDGAGADRDVVLVIPAGALPDGCHVRAYPRRFVAIASIGEEPSFVRGDGGSAIAAGADTRILVPNPFDLAPAEARPDPAVLSVDFVVTARTGRRRVFSQVAVTVDAATIESMPGGAPALGGTVLLGGTLGGILTGLGTRGIAPTPLFGLPRPPPAGGPPADVVELVRRLAAEEQPRHGPRLPTQARFETVLALGSVPTGQTALAWQVVLTGARLDTESRCRQPELGDPGNPAGPDVHAAGIACGGRLAYDLALAAIRRAQPVLPFGVGQPSWLLSIAGDNWDLPPADTAGTVAATLLTTVAAFCDTPELSLAPDILPGTTIQGLVNDLADRIGVPPPTVSVLNADERLIPELRREQSIARQGRRDALWALARAFGEARELVYVEGPAFAATARPAGGAAHAIDLVDLLRTRLLANPRLKVIVCVPRNPDFALDRGGWVRAALAHRRTAIEGLSAAARARVAAFHPIGFPGRPTAIRSTTVVVDDAWCMTGTAHLRRRGMTFDGSLAVAAFDRSLAEGYPVGIADFRRRLMAAKLGVTPAAAVGDATAAWVRLARLDSAFDLVADLLEQGGLGHCTPVWAGPTDTTVLPQTDDIADPDGKAGTDFLALLASLLGEG